MKSGTTKVGKFFQFASALTFTLCFLLLAFRYLAILFVQEIRRFVLGIQFAIQLV
jgi:hypothetical protein